MYRPQGIDYFKAQLEKEVQIQQDRKASLTGDNEPDHGTLQGDKEWAAAEDVRSRSVLLFLVLTFVGAKKFARLAYPSLNASRRHGLLQNGQRR